MLSVEVEVLTHSHDNSIILKRTSSIGDLYFCFQIRDDSIVYGTVGNPNYGPRLWNSLPVDLRAPENIHSFKSRLKTHFFSLAFD